MSSFQNILNNNNRTLSLLASKIQTLPAENSFDLMELLQAVSEVDFDESNTRTAIVFLNNRDDRVATTFHGAQDIINRVLQEKDSSFAQKVREHPNHLVIEEKIRQSLYIPNTPILHLEMGVSNQDGNSKGRLVIGLRLDKIKARLKRALLGEEVEYAILNNRKEVLFGSSKEIEALQQQPDTDLLQSPNGQTFSAFSEVELIKGSPLYLQVLKKRSVFLHEFFKYIRFTLLEIIIFTLLCWIILTSYRSKIVRPLSALARIADRLLKGDHSCKIPPQNSMELALLAQSMDKIQSLLKQQVSIKKDLEEHNKKLITSTSIISKKNKALQLAHAKVKEALRKADASQIAKELFRHELVHKTQDHVQFIANRCLFLKKYLEMPSSLFANRRDKMLSILKSIQSEIDRLQMISQNASSFHRIDINELLDQCCIYHAHEAFDNKTFICKEFSSNLPLVWGDAVALKRVMIQLIAQSIHFASRGQLTIRTSLLSETSISIEIQNKGFGLSKEAMARIIGKVIPVAEDAGQSEEMEKIIAQHQGILRFLSLPGEGALFNIILPIADEDKIENTSSNINISESNFSAPCENLALDSKNTSHVRQRFSLVKTKGKNRYHEIDK